MAVIGDGGSRAYAYDLTTGKNCSRSAIQYGFLTPGNIVLTLEFENGLRQIMKGLP
jgi:hypothetical protein